MHPCNLSAKKTFIHNGNILTSFSTGFSTGSGAGYLWSNLQEFGAPRMFLFLNFRIFEHVKTVFCCRLGIIFVVCSVWFVQCVVVYWRYMSVIDDVSQGLHHIAYRCCCMEGFVKGFLTKGFVWRFVLLTLHHQLSPRTLSYTISSCHSSWDNPCLFSVELSCNDLLCMNIVMHVIFLDLS